MRENLLVFSTHDLEDIYLKAEGTSNYFKSNENEQSLKARHVLQHEILGMRLSSTGKYVAVMMAERIDFFEVILLLNNENRIPLTVNLNFSSSLSSNSSLVWNKVDSNEELHEERFVFLHNSSLSSYKFEDESFALQCTKQNCEYSVIDWGLGSCNTKIVASKDITFDVLCGHSLDVLQCYTASNLGNSIVNHLNWFDHYEDDDAGGVDQILVGLKSRNLSTMPGDAYSSTVRILFLTETTSTSKEYLLPSDIDICHPSPNLFPSKVDYQYQKFYSQYLPDMGVLMIMSNASNGCALFRPNPDNWEWELFSTDISLRLPNMNSLETYPLGNCIINCSKNEYLDVDSGDLWDPRPLVGGNVMYTNIPFSRYLNLLVIMI